MLLFTDLRISFYWFTTRAEAGQSKDKKKFARFFYQLLEFFFITFFPSSI